MKRQKQAWPKGHQLLTLCATIWCVTSWMTTLNVAATTNLEPEAGGERKTMPKLVVQGVVYCEAPSQHHKLLKDAEVQVECNNPGTEAVKVVDTTNARGAFSVTLEDYDYEAWGSNGCKAKLIPTVGKAAATCTTPTNMGGGLTGTNLVLKEKSHDQVVLLAGPFAFKPSELPAEKKKRVATKDSTSSTGSELWYHYTSPPPPHYESPPYHKSPPHHKPDHKAREKKDCHPKHKSPPHHEYKSPPPYHSAPRHDSSPYYYKSPPPYHYNSPPYHYTFPPPVHMSPPYIPYVHHTPPSPIHEVYKSPPPPPHNSYEAPPKQYSPPYYYQKAGGNSNVNNTVKAAPAKILKGSSP